MILQTLRSAAIKLLNPNGLTFQSIYSSLMQLQDDVSSINIAAGGGSSVTGESGITAFAGGGQPGATECTKTYNYIDTVATTGDSIKALAATSTGTASTFQYFQNNGVNDLDLFPQSGDNFYGSAADVAISIPAGQDLTIVCTVTGSFRYS